MASSASDTTTTAAKTRHLRPRESAKKLTTQNDSTGGGSTKAGMLEEEEDDELSANVTASHYLGHRGAKRKGQDGAITIHNTPKRRRVTVGGSAASSNNSEEISTDDLQDVYCWECHKECVDGAYDCMTCPRTYHLSCVKASSQECNVSSSENWTCPVCLTIMKAECIDTQSWAMQQLNTDKLAMLLGFALQRMKHPDVKTSEAFHNPAPKSLLPGYYETVFHPMDLSTLDKNIKKKMYVSTEAFLEDAKWILHNSLIYHGAASKYTADARLIIKICRQEMAEIELCPDCYFNLGIRKDNFFTEPCTFPHCLVWAKLKGFPYWPAKALRVSAGNNVDVRFFGAHDRSWIPVGQVYLLSEEYPQAVKNTRKFGLDKAMVELNEHVRKLRRKFDEFSYAPPKTEFKPEHLYNCAVLFGKKVAGSEAARRLASAAEKRSRNLSGGSTAGANSEDGSVADQGKSGGNKTVLMTSNAADDAGNSSDAESTVSAAKSGQKASNYDSNVSGADRNSSMMDDGDEIQISTEADEEDLNDKLERISKSLEAENAFENENRAQNSNALQESLAAVEKVAGSISGSSTVGPLRVKLSFTRKEKSRTATVAAIAIPDHSAQSPDSTSPGPSSTAQPSTTISDSVAGSKASSRTPQADKSDTQITVSKRSANDLQISEVSSGINGKPARDASALNITPKTPTSKNDQSSARKRNLQTLVEKMHLQQGSGSPATNSDPSISATVPVATATGHAAAAAAASGRHVRYHHGVQNPSASIANTHTFSSRKRPLVPDTTVVCEKYMQRITTFVQSNLNEMMQELQPLLTSTSSQDSTNDMTTQSQNQLSAMRLELAKMQWFHTEAVRTMKHTAKATFTELQQTVELDKIRTMEEVRRKFEEEKHQAVTEAKTKQWCAQCGKEAVFYCCWNTSYCDYPCQQQHWPKHQATCAQIRQQASSSAENANQPTAVSASVQPNNALPAPSFVQYVGGLGAQRLNTFNSIGQPANVVYSSAMPNTAATASFIRATAASGAQILPVHAATANLASTIFKRR